MTLEGIVFDEDYLSPMTTLMPDGWAVVEKRWVSGVCYEIWTTPEGFVVMEWPWAEGVGYSYPSIKIYDTYVQVEDYLYNKEVNMNKSNAEQLVSRLCSSSYILTGELEELLLDSRVYFRESAGEMSVFNEELLPERFVEVADSPVEDYDSVTERFCHAIDTLWNVDKRSTLTLIERMQSILLWRTDYYNVLINKLGLLVYLIEL